MYMVGNADQSFFNKDLQTRCNIVMTLIELPFRFTFRPELVDKPFRIHPFTCCEGKIPFIQSKAAIRLDLDNLLEFI